MTEEYVPSEYARGYLDEIKKDYRKLKESCMIFEQEHVGACQRIGLDLDAFNIAIHPEYPAQGIFQLAQLSDRDRQAFGEYLSNREKMYLLEQCVHSITDDDTREIAKAYYLERKSQPEIAAEIGRTKSYVSKRLDKVEKNEMATTVDRYFDWKYSIPGGRNCYWAGEWEEESMRQKDISNGIFRMPKLPDMSWTKSLKRMGLL